MVESFRDKPYASHHFRQIVDSARRTNPFYRRWITDPEHPPLLDRPTALAHNEELLNGRQVTATTSGSIGVPFRVSQSKEWAALAQRDVQRFVSLLGGRLPCVRIMHSNAPSNDPMLLSIMAPLDEQIAFILRHKVESKAVAITTLPTNADLLSQEVVRRGIDMSFVRRFGMYAETVQEHQKKAVRVAFPNAQIWQTYSSIEFGLIAMMCPYEPDYFHVMAHRLGLEVLREDGTPAATGEPGRVYVTDYFNRAMPLIRYELGDLAVRGVCPCGRIGLPALSRILGRVVSTMLRRDGQRVLFVEFSIALRELPGMKQYKVIQDGVEDFRVLLSAERNLDREVMEVFQAQLGYMPGNVRTEYLETIPRDPNGKYQTLLSNV